MRPNKIIVFGWLRNIAAIGALAELVKDASEDIFFIIATSNQTKQQIIPVIKNNASVTPRNVATPLPPLNLSHIGKQWPAKALKAET
jgi:hypothetical protein